MTDLTYEFETHLGLPHRETYARELPPRDDDFSVYKREAAADRGDPEGLADLLEDFLGFLSANC